MEAISDPDTAWWDWCYQNCTLGNHYTPSAVLWPSQSTHCRHRHNVSWTLPLGIAHTVCFESPNQMVPNKPPIIIIGALHFPELPVFTALWMHAKSSYKAWTLTPESQQIDMCQPKRASSEKQWKWQVKQKTTELRACSWFFQGNYSPTFCKSCLKLPYPYQYHVLPVHTLLCRPIRRQVLKVLGFVPIWILIGWFTWSAPGGQVQQMLRLLPVGANLRAAVGTIHGARAVASEW